MATTAKKDDDEAGLVKISVGLSPETLERLMAVAKAENRSRSNAVETLLQRALDAAKVSA